MTHKYTKIIILIILIITTLVFLPKISSLYENAESIIQSPYGVIIYMIMMIIAILIAFLVARFFFKDIIGKKLENNSFYNKIKGKDNKNILYIIFITRIMPQVSFDLVSYAAGLTRINVVAFAIVTFIGMIPIVFLMSFFGYLIEPFISWFLAALLIVLLIYILYLLRRNR